MAVAAVATAIAAVTGSTTPASADAMILGFTWYAEGGTSRSGPPGTTITAFATEARPNRPFKLVTSPPSQYGCSEFNRQDVNPAIRYSTASGFIGLTSGPINRPVGQYNVCFAEEPGLPHATVTFPVLFTVV